MHNLLIVPYSHCFCDQLAYIPTDASIWTNSLACCAIYRTAYTLASSIQERNLRCWKGAVDNKTALWVAGAFPVFLMSRDAATLKIMHALKVAKCSGKMPCLLSKWLKYPSKTVSNNIQLAKNRQEKKLHLKRNCLPSPSVKCLSCICITAMLQPCGLKYEAFNQVKYLGSCAFFVLVLFPYCAFSCIPCMHKPLFCAFFCIQGIHKSLFFLQISITFFFFF